MFDDAEQTDRKRFGKDWLVADVSHVLKLTETVESYKNWSLTV